MSAFWNSSAPPEPPNGPVTPDNALERSSTPVTTNVSPWRLMLSASLAPVTPDAPVAPAKPPELNSANGTLSNVNSWPANVPSSKGLDVTPGALLGEGESEPGRSVSEEL